MKPNGVSIAVFRGRDVLLVKRGKAPYLDYWSFPGGRIEDGEATAGAALRELREETGLAVANPRSLGVFAAGEGGYVLEVFVARYEGGEPVAADDAADVAFVPHDDLSGYLVTPDLPALLPRAYARLTEA
ncbi:NUDIX domain-containing protein [Cucumibacter marinus]|uniref:NUDIX domain-containing protein n=1 Tax=Cucumibacter marinus TaxID=1121252 RepID=UPI00146FB43C|nr:NUDIX domain-containing protein [Cucumibacter marinus]